ncbi:uncharacterized protein An01g13720 [Aspergillus niger]|uniref:Contig An01c0440, genomic contig n=2 Tax=Aspergillus niger TaxID=5061 RepID=A2QB34_ASPNC|nr:uncharacterized protein An01g13720 [Aspergillus niger]CAK37378.1 unnamed protein product [Aspergillus niger]
MANNTASLPTECSPQSERRESHGMTPPFSKPASFRSSHQYTHPAGVNFQHELIKPDEDLQRYLDFQLTTPKLNRIHHLLWLAGLPRAARPLHRQKLMKRTIILTESPDEHLVWSPGQILIKPVPEYLLDHEFWVRELCPHRELHAAACGLLLSYAWLITGLIDFQLAKDERILPSDVTWDAWTLLIRQFLEWIDNKNDEDRCSTSLPTEKDYVSQPQPAIINKRYEFGELRLSRLNSLTVVGHASGTGDRRAAGESAVSEGLRRLHLGVYFLHSGSGVDYADANHALNAQISQIFGGQTCASRMRAFESGDHAGGRALLQLPGGSALA